jgi:hypothetical protein
MTLTHKQIAAMTRVQVNVAIADRRDEYDWSKRDCDDSDKYPDYCGDWAYCRCLLDELKDNSKDLVSIIDHWFYADPTTGEEFAEYVGHTLKEAIARCWLEWYEVNNAAKNEVKQNE